MRVFAVFCLCACVFVLVPVSEPGQLMDCSEWVPVQPGYSRVAWIDDAETLGSSRFLDIPSECTKIVDNEGRLVHVGRDTRVDG